MSVFYDHLTELGGVHRQLSAKFSELEAQEVLLALDEAMHHRVLEVVLSALPFHVHGIFMERFASDPAASHHMEFIRLYDPEIEAKIREEAGRENRRFLDAIHL